MAIGQPFLYNAPAKVTSNWFPQKERPMATMAGTQMNIFGIFIGFLLPGFFVDTYSDDVILTPSLADSYKQQMFNMLLAVSIASTVIMILVLLFFKEKPGKPVCGSRGGDASASNGYDSPSSSRAS